ncbi:hypothetical protein BH10PLA1_BH10PLA1_19470 [soil metagenome]
MTVLTIDEILADPDLAGWTFDEKGHLAPVTSFRMYRGSYGEGGTTAANMAEGILTQMTASPVLRGLLYFRNVTPFEAAGRIFKQLIGLRADEAFKVATTALRYENEPDELLTVIAWALACDWEFAFIDPQHQFAIHKTSARNISYVWRSDDLMSKHLSEIMSALQCVRL